MDALERRVRAWTRDDDVVAEICAEVLRTFNLARGGAAFEGFVQGRFIEAVGAAQQGIPHPRPLRCAARTSAAMSSAGR